MAAGHVHGVSEHQPQQVGPSQAPRAPASVTATTVATSRRRISARSAAYSPATLRWVTRSVSCGTDPRATMYGARNNASAANIAVTSRGAPPDSASSTGAPVRTAWLIS